MWEKGEPNSLYTAPQALQVYCPKEQKPRKLSACCETCTPCRSGISDSNVPVPPAIRRRQRQLHVLPAFFQDTVLRP